MVRTYTSTFLNVAEDAYQKRVDMEAAIVSFLASLRGLVAICHTLVEGTVDELEDGPLKDSITCGMDGHAQEYSNQMNNLLDKFMEAMISGTYEVHLFWSTYCCIHLLQIFALENRYVNTRRSLVCVLTSTVCIYMFNR
ncbi:hypothetical protein HU200_046340 [Digitaria exilis]|uniref:Uncharacterized protein n=1 Tax=Digitaria exilis TaxID=1010633 RepID=A0A835E9J8_9POAL|nr:hypothetical protein HU200_046340 [Digitaria exilis]